MIYDCYNFNYNYIKTLKVLDKSKKRNAKKYLDIITAFDIECTNIDDIEQAVMYIWQYQVGLDYTIIGRTWDEYIYFLNKLQEVIPDDVYMVTYTHNLSYEFSFLKGIYEFKSDEVFATDKRKVLKCTMFNKFEYRCSYYLTNLSLDKFLKNMNVENKKLTYDYKKKRYYFTKLTDDEIAYCINDVKGLVQALSIKFKVEGDDLQTTPLTSTGYVRRDVKKAMLGFNYLQLKDMLPDKEVYKLLREAFRGGDTIANRWWVTDIINDISSVDIVSSYPTSLILDKYPMTKFIPEDVKDFEELLDDKERALLFRCRLYDVDVNNLLQGHTYLSTDKCRYIANGTIANGRIVKCDSLETTLTDIDYSIIKRRYKFKIEVLELYSSQYKYLPSMFRNVIIKYYREKTILKGSKEGTDDYLFYMKNKERLNSCYGMTAEDIGRDSIIYEDRYFKLADEPLDVIITRNNKKAFLSYAWGVWCTAHSRKRLADGIDIVTNGNKVYSNFIYSDTDSVKYLGDADFTRYNEDIIEQAELCDAYAEDREGNVHYMGVYEKEDGYGKPNRASFMGAKKYVIEDNKKKLHITIAGVNKRKGGDELEKIENFKEGFIFTKSGGTEARYNDKIDMYINVEGKDIRVTDNIYICDSTYTLGLTAEYKAILDGLIEIKYSNVDIPGFYKVKN